MTIFVDESGFTGNDLLNADQPYFVLSSVSISDFEAKHIVDAVKKNFGIKAQELKAGKLLKTSRGRDAVNYIFHNLKGRYALSYNHKIYALCCKFFEYVFEPVLKDNNYFFYEKKFHLFISNTLYAFFVAGDKAASEILISFAKMMREKDFDTLRSLLEKSPSTNPDDVFCHIVDFMEGYAQEINEELDGFGAPDDIGKWILDLSNSALWSLLRHWSESHLELVVVCDSSKPLNDSSHRLDVMIGRTDRPKIFHPVKGFISPVFNLKKEIDFKDSKESEGVQLADIMASSAVYAIKEKDRDLLNMVKRGMIEECIIPAPEHVDLKKKQPILNAILLVELANRARKGYSPIHQIEGYYKFLEMQYESKIKGELVSK